MTPPVFILAPGRSFTSVACAMLGQHPELYGLPEVNLAVTETMEEWSEQFWSGPGRVAGQGLLRAVAELHLGGQSEHTVALARQWLRHRRRWRTADVFQSLVDAAHPLGVVDKSPAYVVELERLERLGDTFPDARFLHLVRHPRSQGESLLGTIWGRRRLVATHCVDRRTNPPTPDPQIMWYESHCTIVEFLESVPQEQQRLLHGEDLLARPDEHLRSIARWLGIRTDDDAIEAMKHPERSPFACFGPPGARFGNDPGFLESPALRVNGPSVSELTGPLAWRRDGEGFTPEVKDLAVELGYS